MSTRYSAAEWSQWLEEFRESDLSVKQFCEVIEVSVATFYNWQRRLRRQPPSGSGNGKVQTVLARTEQAKFSESFIPVSLLSETVEIRLPAGASVELPNEADSLRPVLRVLAELGSQS